MITCVVTELITVLTSTAVATVMAKKSAAELFEHYYMGLVYSLPMKDADFMYELLKHDLLPEDVKCKLELLTVHSERSSYFLDNVIKPGLEVGNTRSFVSLLTVMKCNKYDNIKDLATKIEKELAVDVKCKIVVHNCTFMYH